jgi:hypothetical protein
MLVESVLRWRACMRSGAEVECPKDTVAQEQDPYQAESGEPNPKQLEGI